MRRTPDRETAEEAAAFVLETAAKKGAAAADVLYIAGAGHSLSLLDGEPERISTGFSVGIGIRTLDSSGRQGVSRVNSLSRGRLEEAVDWSISNCGACEEDPFVGLGPALSQTADDLDLYDSEIAELDTSDRMNFCKRMWECARDEDPRVVSVRSASWGDGVQEMLYASSEGSMAWSKGTTAGCGVSVVLSSGEDMEMGGYGEADRLLSSLSPERTAREAVERSAMVLGGKPLPTGKYDLILDPESSASFIEVVGELFLASNIHKNRSLLMDRLGERVSSASLTLVDDGTLKRGLGSAPFDDEGVPASKTRILAGGVAESWLYNLKYARMDGVRSTGNASRPLSGVPDVGISNLCVEPGKWTRQDLLLQVRRGICVKELLGLHTINPVSGDFSLGIKGARVQNGEVREPVGGMTIAGNILDFLDSLDLLGNDFKFSGNIGSC